MLQIHLGDFMLILSLSSMPMTLSSNYQKSIKALDAIRFHKEEPSIIPNDPSPPIIDLTTLRDISRFHAENPKIGNPFEMHFRAPSNLDVEKWEWITPKQKHYRLVENKLLIIEKDNSTTDVTDLGPFNFKVHDKMGFNLTIKNLEATEFGKWTFKAFHQKDAENPFHVLVKTITSDIRKETDFHLPTHIKPHHYRTWLTPFIMEGNWTIKGRVEIDAV